MFKFLKDKLKNSISSFSKKIEEEGKEEVVEAEEVEEEKIEEESKPEKKGFFERIKDTFVKKEDEIREVDKEKIVEKETKKQDKIKETRKDEEVKKTLTEELKEPKEKEVKEIKERPETRSFFSKIKEKIVTKRIDERQFDNLFWDLEVALLENNVAVEVIEKIKQDLKNDLVEKPLRRDKIEEIIKHSLKKSIEDLFTINNFDFIKRIKEKKTYIICFVGINGSGKTTTIAKIAKLLKDKGLSIVLAASDTFRAASIEQLQKHADNIGIKLIKHDYGSDPAAVAFDAIKYARARNIDVVLIDTAGRLQSNINLMDELKKVVRVAKPDLKIFVGEAITGNDCVEQALQFNNAIGIDGIILAKTDIDEKGGAAVSLSYITKKPIIFFGVGQSYEDLREFNKDIIMKNILSS
jgi:fused signal recognition particle receptor